MHDLEYKDVQVFISALISKKQPAWDFFYKEVNPVIEGVVTKYSFYIEPVDAIQTVYEKLFEDNFSAFVVYIMRLARNTVLNANRKEQRLKKRLTEHDNDNDKPSDFIDNASNPEKILISSETTTELYKELMKLKLPYREVLQLQIQGYKNREIAEMLNENLNTILTRSARAKKQLAKKVKENEIFYLA